MGRDHPLRVLLDSCDGGRNGGALIAGPAGIGKTRLLDEALTILDRRSLHVERFVASAATRTVPFGPLVSLLPRGGGDRTQLHASVRVELRRRAAGRPTVVAVDDAHLLDPASKACVVDLVHHGEIAVLLTVRNDEGLPSDLVHLWTSEALVRVDLEPLTTDETVELTEVLLDGPVATGLGAQMYELSGGVPLLARELLIDARALGSVDRRDGIWKLLGPMRSGARLQELVAARLALLEHGPAELFEMIALGEPLDVDLLSTDEHSDLDTLERLGLVTLELSDQRWFARVDHPLLGEALVRGLPTRRRVDVVRSLATRMVQAGCPGRGDALRAARWLAETGDSLDPDIAVRAGHEALAALELELAVDLATHAVDDRVFDAHLLIGEARRLQARAGEAETSLAIAADLATDDEDRVRIAMWRSTLLAHHAGRPADAIRLLEDTAASVSDPVRALELVSEASFLAGLLGRFDDAVRTNRAILARNDVDDDTVWTAGINLLYSQTMLGQLDGVDDHVARALSMVERVETVRPEGVDLLWALRTGIAIQRGDLAEGEREILDHIAGCEARGTIFGLTAAILQQLLLLRGSPELLPLAERALRDLDASDPYAVRPIALACTALSHASVGDIDAARDHLERIPPDAVDDVRAAPFIGRADAVVTAHDDPEKGAALAATSGRRSVEQLHTTFGVLALYEAAMMGTPDLVADDIAAATSTATGRMFTTMTRHVAALVAAAPDELEAVGAAFAQMGARPLASTAFADAARRHTEPMVRHRAAARSLQWGRAAWPMVPARLEIDGAVSARELEVAHEAADGRTSREIGERLFLSIRTVDNHLHRVYAKLGVSTRSELATVLEPRP